MMEPSYKAVEAAAMAVSEFDGYRGAPRAEGYGDEGCAALRAALPVLERQIRERIVEELRAIGSHDPRDAMAMDSDECADFIERLPPFSTKEDTGE